MGRLLSVVVWALMLAAVAGGGIFAALMLTGPKNDPSVYGTAMLAGIGAAAVGALVGAIYGAVKQR